MSREKVAYLTEKKRLLEDFLSLNQSNMELREVFEARDNMLQIQIDELKTSLAGEVNSRNVLLEQNENLNRLVKSIEYDKKNADATTMELKQQLGEAAALVKDHDNKALEMLEREKNENDEKCSDNGRQVRT